MRASSGRERVDSARTLTAERQERGLRQAPRAGASCQLARDLRGGSDWMSSAPVQTWVFRFFAVIPLIDSPGNGVS